MREKRLYLEQIDQIDSLTDFPSVTLRLLPCPCKRVGLQERIGVAKATSWKGPYGRPFGNNDPLWDKNDQAAFVEDPSVWQDERGFHMISHGHFDERGYYACEPACLSCLPCKIDLHCFCINWTYLTGRETLLQIPRRGR